MELLVRCRRIGFLFFYLFFGCFYLWYSFDFHLFMSELLLKSWIEFIILCSHKMHASMMIKGAMIKNAMMQRCGDKRCGDIDVVMQRWKTARWETESKTWNNRHGYPWSSQHDLRQKKSISECVIQKKSINECMIQKKSVNECDETKEILNEWPGCFIHSRNEMALVFNQNV